MATQTMTSTDVSSASARALAAASASARPKHRPSPLPTPQSATFHSTSLQSPLPSASCLGSAGLGSASFSRPDKASVKTPLTPPSAYLAFLNQVNSKAKSPLAGSHFPPEPRSPYPWPNQPASARPALTTQDSAESNASHASANSNLSTSSAPSKPLARRSSDPAKPDKEPPRAASTSVLPSHPHPSLRRPSLMIPESPSIRTPSLYTPDAASRSAISATSPASATAAKNYYLGLSPMTDGGDRSAVTPGGTGSKRPFHIRHVITRTVTYTRPARTPTSDVHPHTLPRIVGYASRATNPEPSRPVTSNSDDGSKGKMSLGYVLGTSEPVPSCPAGCERRKTPDKEPEAKREDSDMDDTAAAAQSVQRSSQSQAAWGQPPAVPLIGDAPKGKRRKIE